MLGIGVLAGLTIEHIMLMDLMSDTAIRLIEASKPENLRTLTVEEANALIVELGAKRDLLRERMKEHKE